MAYNNLVIGKLLSRGERRGCDMTSCTLAKGTLALLCRTSLATLKISKKHISSATPIGALYLQRQKCKVWPTVNSKYGLHVRHLKWKRTKRK